MKKINIIKKNTDYNRIIKSCKPYKYKDYIIYIEKNNDDIYHFGFSVSKKIGGAVLRNKIKRQLKNIIDKKNYQNGFNCIIMVRKGILDKSFTDMETELLYILKKVNITKEKQNE
jgi:ribonuclease P protein component